EDQEPGGDGRERQEHVAEVVDVGEPDRGITLGGFAERAGHAPVPDHAEEPGQDGAEPDHRQRRRQTLDAPPRQIATDREQPDRVEEVGRAQERPREAGRERVGEEEEREPQLVGEVVDAVDDEREAVRADTGGELDGEHGGVERECEAERPPAVGHRSASYDAGGRTGPSGASSSSIDLRAAVTYAGPRATSPGVATGPVGRSAVQTTRPLAGSTRLAVSPTTMKDGWVGASGSQRRMSR